MTFACVRTSCFAVYGEALLSLGATKVVDTLPESVTAKRAMEIARQKNPSKLGLSGSHAAGSGSQPRNSQSSGVSYKDIMVGLGLIRVPSGFRGSKPPSSTWEADNYGREHMRGAQWWMNSGGFKASQIFM